MEPTWEMQTGPAKLPARPRAPVPDELLHCQPAEPARVTAHVIVQTLGAAPAGRRKAAGRALAKRWTAPAALAAMRAHAQALPELPAQTAYASDKADVSLGELLIKWP